MAGDGKIMTAFVMTGMISLRYIPFGYQTIWTSMGGSHSVELPKFINVVTLYRRMFMFVSM